METEPYRPDHVGPQLVGDEVALGVARAKSAQPLVLLAVEQGAGDAVESRRGGAREQLAEDAADQNRVLTVGLEGERALHAALGLPNAPFPVELGRLRLLAKRVVEVVYGGPWNDALEPSELCCLPGAAGTHDHEQHGGEPTMRPMDGRPSPQQNILFVTEGHYFLEGRVYPELSRRHRVALDRTEAPEAGGGLGLRTKTGQARVELWRLARMLRNPSLRRGDWTLVCTSGHYAALLSASLARALGRDVRAILYNLYLHGLGERAAVQGILRALVRDHVGVIVQSQAEVEYFRRVTGTMRVAMFPYCQDPMPLHADDLRLGEYVFAGGFTNRDFDSVLDCAARLPRIPFTLVCSSLNVLTRPVPSNVRVLRDIPVESFNRLLAGARLVVVPLRVDVGASGQIVVLTSMQAGKTTVVPSYDVVSQYVEDGTSGVVYEPGGGAALCAAVEELYDDLDRLRRIGAAAERRYRAHFTRGSFEDFASAAIERWIGEPSSAVA